MTHHLSDRQLLAFVEGELPPGRRARAEAHLQTCPACNMRLERLTQVTEELSTTLHAVGEQVPLTPARSWEEVARRWRRQRPQAPVPRLRPLLRHAAILAILGLAVVGLAGLIHTLAVTGPATTGPTPTPTPTPVSSPSPAPGPLPRPYPNRLASPVSILILGVDAERDSARADEVDALMLLCISDEAQRAFMLSIPRHLYVEVPGHGKAPAGSIYRLGAERGQAEGLTLARESISATLGFPVQHTVLVRLDAFVTLIDTIGGVDVQVPHPIEDPTFPDGHGGYAPLSIDAGRQHFDGVLALRYARTRVEPSPSFDRAFRQRQIVLAAHRRVMERDLLPELISQAPTLWSHVSDGLETDLTLSDVIDLALLATHLSTEDIATASLGECCTVQHVTPGGQRVLSPHPEEIQTLMRNLLEENWRTNDDLPRNTPD